jgi:hypothetical protein
MIFFEYNMFGLRIEAFAREREFIMSSPTLMGRGGFNLVNCLII